MSIGRSSSSGKSTRSLDKSNSPCRLLSQSTFRSTHRDEWINDGIVRLIMNGIRDSRRCESAKTSSSSVSGFVRSRKLFVIRSMQRTFIYQTHQVNSNQKKLNFISIQKILIVFIIIVDLKQRELKWCIVHLKNEIWVFCDWCQISGLDRIFY